MKEQTRRLALFLLVASLLCAGWVQAGTEAAEKKYPPYPDVWDWIMMFPNQRTDFFQADAQPNGDVRISYLLKSKRPTPQEQYVPQGGAFGFAYFERKAVAPAQKVKPYSIQFQSWQVRLANGKTLQSLPSDESAVGCFKRFGNNLVLKDTDGKELLTKALVYVLERPRRFRTNPACYDGKDFTYQVEYVPARFVALEDGTFLVVDGAHGLVVRFDERFTTKSTLLNRRVFVIDIGDVWRSGDFGSKENGDLNWQQFNDALYRHVMALKRRN